MPKYSDKMRLKRYLAHHEDVDELIEFLILDGYPEKAIETVEKTGIDFFVSGWEEAVEYILKDTDHEEYDLDLCNREELYNILQHTSKEQVSKFERRIKLADEIFRKATVEIEQPSCQKNPSQNKDRWWAYRYPK